MPAERPATRMLRACSEGNRAAEKSIPLTFKRLPRLAGGGRWARTRLGREVGKSRDTN